MKGKKLVLLNIISSLMTQALTVIYGFIAPKMIISYYGSDVNGLVSSISQFLAYIVLLEAGIGPVIKNVLYKPLIEKKSDHLAKILGAADSFFKKLSFIFVGYVLILCFLYPRIINNNYSDTYIITLLLILTIGQFFEFFMGLKYKIFLQADQKNYIIDFTSCILYILKILLVVLCVKMNFSIHLLELFLGFLYVLNPLVLKLYFNKKYNFKIKKDKAYKLPKQWDGFTHHIASTVQNNTDVVILSIFSSLENVSIYSVYSLVTNGIRKIILALTNGIDAYFGKMLVSKYKLDFKYKFKIYNIIFYTVTTILLSCCLILIMPFISLYTINVTDADYYKPLFAVIMIFAEFMFVIRYPFSTITYANGNFKETRNFSIIEPIVNLIVSTILVVKFGIVGVAIGTLISMPIRSIGFIVYATKNIVKDKFFDSFKIIIVSFLELMLVFLVNYKFININVSNYIQWIIFGIISFVIVSAFIIIINFCFFRKDLLYKQIKANNNKTIEN